MSFSQDMHACMLSHFSHIGLFETLWTVACQASLSMGFSRQKYWSGLQCLPPRDLPDPGKPGFLAWQADSLASEPPGKPNLAIVTLVAQRLKCLPSTWETWVQSLGREDPLEMEMAPHSSIFAWRIPWTEEPGRL